MWSCNSLRSTKVLEGLRAKDNEGNLLDEKFPLCKAGLSVHIRSLETRSSYSQFPQVLTPGSSTVSISLSVYLSFFLYIHPQIYSIYLFFYSFISPSVYMSVSLFLCLSDYLPAFLFVYRFISPSHIFWESHRRIYISQKIYLYSWLRASILVLYQLFNGVRL